MNRSACFITRSAVSADSRAPWYCEAFFCCSTWVSCCPLWEASASHGVPLQARVRTRTASLVGLHRASGLPLRFVLLRTAGKPDAVLMSTDLSLTPREIAGLYADRFAIEMTFRELKQHFGLGDYQARWPQAMLRHVHLSGVACALTQLLTLRPPAKGFAGRHRSRSTKRSFCCARPASSKALTARSPTAPHPTESPELSLAATQRPRGPSERADP